jgi:hypothetical protein
MSTALFARTNPKEETKTGDNHVREEEVDGWLLLQISDFCLKCIDLVLHSRSQTDQLHP